MKLGLRLAFRYVLSGGSQTALMAALVMIGVTAYTFITATVQGVQANVIDQSLGSSSHLTVEPFDRLPQTLNPSAETLVVVQSGNQRDKRISDWQSVMKRMATVPGIIAISPNINGSGFAERGTQIRPITIKGGNADELENIVHMKKNLVAGNFQLSAGRVVLGKTLAGRLSVGVGDRLRLRSEKGVAFEVWINGIVYAGSPNFDDGTVFTSLADAQRLMNLEGGISTIETKVDEIFSADQVAFRVADRTGLRAKPWTEENKQIMTLIQSQNIATGVIRGFALLSIAFGIGSVLNVTVAQKSKEIGIIKGMGGQTGSILSAFVCLGALIGLIGGVSGAGLTYVVMAMIRTALGAAPKGSPTFSMDFRPEFIWQAVVSSLIVASLGAIVPARNASRMDPVEAIRNV